MTTKQSKNWVFTINNPTNTEDCPKDWPGYRYIVYQREKGETGTEHYQGYVIWKSNKTLTAVKKIHKTAHWENRMGTHKEAKDYCMKEDTRMEGPWEYGQEPR